MVLLLHWSMLNYAAVVKILKKHGGFTCSQQSPSRIVPLTQHVLYPAATPVCNAAVDFAQVTGDCPKRHLAELAYANCRQELWSGVAGALLGKRAQAGEGFCLSRLPAAFTLHPWLIGMAWRLPAQQCF